MIAFQLNLCACRVLRACATKKWTTGISPPSHHRLPDPVHRQERCKKSRLFCGKPLMRRACQTANLRQSCQESCPELVCAYPYLLYFIITCSKRLNVLMTVGLIQINGRCQIKKNLQNPSNYSSKKHQNFLSHKAPYKETGSLSFCDLKRPGSKESIAELSKVSIRGVLWETPTALGQNPSWI